MKLFFYKKDGPIESTAVVFAANLNEVIKFVSKNITLTPDKKSYTEVYLHIGDVLTVHNNELVFDQGFEKSVVDKLERS